MAGRPVVQGTMPTLSYMKQLGFPRDAHWERIEDPFAWGTAVAEALGLDVGVGLFRSVASVVHYQSHGHDVFWTRHGSQGFCLAREDGATPQRMYRISLDGTVVSMMSARTHIGAVMEFLGLGRSDWDLVGVVSHSAGWKQYGFAVPGHDDSVWLKVEAEAQSQGSVSGDDSFGTSDDDGGLLQVMKDVLGV